MQDNQGVFIVLEGADGSGKGTQFKLLAERLKAVGYEIEVFDFPQYDKPSSYFVKQYLNGTYGPASSVSPYTASLFYALDRYEAAPQIKKALKDGKIILSNRYVGSNMAHQGSKFDSPQEQRGFFLWEDALEYGMLGIPRPSLNLFLKVPAETSFELIHKKAPRDYTEKSHDEHEANIEHLQRSVNAYDLLCKLFPKDFKTIECTDGSKLMSIPDINNKIWEVLQPILPPRPADAGRPAVVRLNDLSARRVEEVAEDPRTDSHAQTDNIMNIKINGISLFTAGAMLTTSSLKLRILSRPGSEPQYFQLPKTDKQLTVSYKSALDDINQLQREAMKHIHRIDGKAGPRTRAAIELMTPLSKLVDVEIRGQASDIGILIKNLKAHKETEANWVANQLYTAAKKAKPNEFKSNAQNKKSNDDYISLFMDGAMSSRGSDSSEPLKLLLAWPRNEFDLLADSVYAKADLPRDEILFEMENWSYEKKFKVLSSLAKQDDLPASQIVYRFDAIATSQEVESLLFAGLIKDLAVQAPNARYGYQVPSLVESAKLDDLFMEAFDRSLELYSIFQSSGYEDLAVYGTLLGHRRRWMFTTSCNDVKAMSLLVGNEVGELTRQILEKSSEVHPVIYGADENNQTPKQEQNSNHQKHTRQSQRKTQ